LAFLTPPLAFTFVVSFNLALLTTSAIIVGTIALGRLAVNCIGAFAEYSRMRSGSDDSGSINFG
jgi:hypothetical protein